jgi:hypothetical protein
MVVERAERKKKKRRGKGVGPFYTPNNTSTVPSSNERVLS